MNVFIPCLEFQKKPSVKYIIFSISMSPNFFLFLFLLCIDFRNTNQPIHTLSLYVSRSYCHWIISKHLILVYWFLLQLREIWDEMVSMQCQSIQFYPIYLHVRISFLLWFSKLFPYILFCMTIYILLIIIYDIGN